MIAYEYAMEKNDYKRIEKLNRLNNPETFYDDVRKLVKNVHSDHVIRRWEILSGIRYRELTKEDN